MNNTKLSSCLDLLIKQKKYVEKLEQEVSDLKKELIVDKKKMSKSKRNPKEKKDISKNIRIPKQEQKKKKKIEKS
jgi:hypothetical protein